MFLNSKLLLSKSYIDNLIIVLPQANQCGYILLDRRLRVHRLWNLDLEWNLAMEEECKQSLLHSNIEIILIIISQFYVIYYVIHY